MNIRISLQSMASKYPGGGRLQKFSFSIFFLIPGTKMSGIKTWAPKYLLPSYRLQNVWFWSYIDWRTLFECLGSGVEILPPEAQIWSYKPSVAFQGLIKRPINILNFHIRIWYSNTFSQKNFKKMKNKGNRDNFEILIRILQFHIIIDSC